MAKKTIHISGLEAFSDLSSVLVWARDGAEVVIDIDEREPIVVVRAAPRRGRLISECIALAKAHEEETGKTPVPDPDFAADVDEIVKHRKPWNPSAWE
jgi:hypothetical protein